MTIGEMIRQGFHYARTCKSLWLFGFVVGLASGGSNGGGGGGQDGAGEGAAGAVGLFGLLRLFGFSTTDTVLLVVAIVLLIVAAIVMRFISEGALIEGVVRARRGGPMTTGEGFRAGWAHWGVLLRIGLMYLGTILVSLAVLLVPCVLAFRALGRPGGLAVLLLALMVGVPWLITVHLVQAFASRIAVLENRRALDAVAKARLFLHGRLMHGLKLIVATFVGTLALIVVGFLLIAPGAVLLALLVRASGLWPFVVFGVLVGLPVFFVLTAMIGTLRSSIWTIGYVTQVEP